MLDGVFCVMLSTVIILVPFSGPLFSSDPKLLFTLQIHLNNESLYFYYISPENKLGVGKTSFFRFTNLISSCTVERVKANMPNGTLIIFQ